MTMQTEFTVIDGGRNVPRLFRAYSVFEKFEHHGAVYDGVPFPAAVHHLGRVTLAYDKVTGRYSDAAQPGTWPFNKGMTT